ncbi:MAG: DUF5372 family protein [Terriglobia bacterium]
MNSASRKLLLTPGRSCCAVSRYALFPTTNSYISVETETSSFRLSPIRTTAFRRSEQTALVHSSPWGWAEIVHPFHPLRGRRFEVLKKRRIAGVDTLILRELERGTLSIPREWTDWADPTPYDALTRPPHRLAAECLFELVALLEALAASVPPPPKTPRKKALTKEMPDATVRPVVSVVR